MILPGDNGGSAVLEVSLFNIENFKVDGGAMFGVVPKTLWSKSVSADSRNLCTLALRSLLVETGDRLILIDSGWGDKQGDKFFRYVYRSGGEGLLGGLANRGYRPEDVTDLVFTHLHADHCGGAILNPIDGGAYRHQFPNARYHISKIQWEWAVKNNLREEDSFLAENIRPLDDGDRLNLIEKDGFLVPGFELRICSGHTPGLMYAIIDYKGKRVVYLGDLIPTVAHLPLIWNSSYEINPLKSIEEKQLILREALKNGYILAFQHDEKVECCDLKETPGGIRAKDVFAFVDI